jgi:hypothetical protein
MLPNFIGIGAPKAGTTWVFEALNKHPQIYMPPAKELHFFADYNIGTSIEEYTSYFEKVNPRMHQAIGEISATYLTSVHAPERIKNLIPNVKLLICVRNPIDQVYSLYWHMLRQNFNLSQKDKIPTSFEEAIEKYEQTLLSQALYFTNIQKWLNHFDKSQLKIIFFDDIIAEPQGVISDLFQFLEVDPEASYDLPKNNFSTRQGVSPKNTTYHQIYKSLYGFANKQIYHQLKKMIGMKNATMLKDYLNIRFVLEKLFFDKGYPKMKLETREYLKGYYREEVHNLEILCERKLPQWL